MLRYFHSIHVRAMCICSIVLLAFFICCSQVYAAPGESIPATQESSEKWVDLQAHVPEDFDGTVSVLLQQDITGDLFTLTSYPINNYLNSIQLPTGTYTVMQTFTSEDAFLYDTFIETETFDLQSSMKLDVTVTANPEGTAFLNNLQAKQETEKKIEEDTPELKSPESEAPVNTEVSDPAPSQEASTPESDNNREELASPDSKDPMHTDDQSKDAPSSETDADEGILVPFLKSALGFLCAVAIFAIIFFGVFHLYHRTTD